MVSKAFQVLSGSYLVLRCPWRSLNIFGTDPQKRAVYDRSGGDPESRFGGMSPSGPSSGFPASAFGGTTFEGELSPEDLFNMFFGGGGGPAFTTGPGDLLCRVHVLNVSDCYP